MEGAQSFLWSLGFAAVGLTLFGIIKKNTLIRLLFLVLGIGGVYLALLYWRFMDGRVAFSMTLLVALIAGIVLMKDREKATPWNLIAGLILTIGSTLAFLVVIGALSSTSGAFAQAGDVMNAAGNFFRQWAGMTTQGIEELNR